MLLESGRRRSAESRIRTNLSFSNACCSCRTGPPPLISGTFSALALRSFTTASAISSSLTMHEPSSLLNICWKASSSFDVDVIFPFCRFDMAASASSSLEQRRMRFCLTVLGDADSLFRLGKMPKISLTCVWCVRPGKTETKHIMTQAHHDPKHLLYTNVPPL